MFFLAERTGIRDAFRCERCCCLHRLNTTRCWFPHTRRTHMTPTSPDRNKKKRKFLEEEEEEEELKKNEEALPVAAAPPAARAGAFWSEDVWGRRLTCPITHQLFADPVMASDGFLYERSAIERWFAARRTSPLMGNTPMDGVFHAVPTVRAEVDAFLSSLPLERQRVWRRWSRSAAFQATMDALEPALVAAAGRAPVAWRRLMHERDWAAWIAPPPEGERVEGNAAALAPPGTAAAQRARRHGWTEEDLANIWHRLPELAAGVAAGEGGEEEQEQGEEQQHLTTTKSSLVYRATRRLMEYVRLTCAGYVMACATAYRCAETGAWAAATAVVNHAETLDSNILVRMMAASFADSRSGWRLIRVLCDRALERGEEDAAAAAAAADDDDGSSSSDDAGSIEEEEEEEERRVLMMAAEDDEEEVDAYRSSEDEGDDEGQEGGGAVARSGDDHDDDSSSSGSSSIAAALPPLPAAAAAAAPARAPPMSLLGSRSGTTQSAENRAFSEAMALVDRCGAGLFSSEDDGRDGYGTRRGRDRYPRGAW